jgi:hypothetical protein
MDRDPLSSSDVPLKKPGAGRPDPSRIEQLCIERGLKMTGQRRLIARVLSEAEDHPDVEELYRRASPRSIARCGCSRRRASSSGAISAAGARGSIPRIAAIITT